MNRLLRNSLWFVVGFLLAAGFTVAFAETIPATGVPIWKVTQAPSYASTDQAAACQSYLTFRGYVYEGVTDAGNATGSCKYHTVGDPGFHQALGMFSTGGGYSCPANQNWTLDGSNCVRADCVLPQTRQADGTCAAPQCQLGPNAQVGTGLYEIPRPVPSGVTYCVSNCSVYMVPEWYTPTVNYARAYVNGAGMAASTCASGSSVPGEKSPEPEKTASPCAAGQGVATNAAGKVVCVDQNAVPSAEPPKVNKETQTKTNPDGSQTITNTTTTCTGAGACSTVTNVTVTNASNGQPGTAGTPGTTTSVGDKPSAEQAEFCAKNPTLQICKGGMAEEATQLKVEKNTKDTLDELKKITTPTVTDASLIEGNTFENTTGRQDLTDKDNELKNYANGSTVDSGVSSSKSAWESAMGSGWWEPIELGGCTPFQLNFSGRSVTIDHCEKAALISQIGAYGMWIMLLIGGFVMLTGGRTT